MYDGTELSKLACRTHITALCYGRHGTVVGFGKARSGGSSILTHPCLPACRRVPPPPSFLSIEFPVRAVPSPHAAFRPPLLSIISQHGTSLPPTHSTSPACGVITRSSRCTLSRHRATYCVNSWKCERGDQLEVTCSSFSLEDGVHGLLVHAGWPGVPCLEHPSNSLLHFLQSYPKLTPLGSSAFNFSPGRSFSHSSFSSLVPRVDDASFQR
ncbi:hypothetical protein B0T19DRAFT_53331 [Cercophora scortea]|uniref:Uncharacterized protein n=1 Tax=Cercophora scortea TaxID=314031 RepID=A0AAE0J5D7_9PEZI|nr:hypothetical protein B0T19DRAFT_53331 [Cercophora scortea]